MNKKSMIAIGTLFIVVIVYVIFRMKFISYATIWTTIVFTLMIDSLYIVDNKKYSKLLVLLTLISTALFSSYIYIGVNTGEPSNVGDFSMLPILLFIVSFPFIGITHSLILYKLSLKSE